MAFGLVKNRPLQSSPSIPPPSPSIALQLGASVEVKRQAIPLTVIKTIPTPIKAIKMYENHVMVFRKQQYFVNMTIKSIPTITKLEIIKKLS